MSQRGTHSEGSELFRDSGQDGLMHRAFLRGAGHSADAVRKSPVIGIANTASDLNPCNAGFTDLVEDVKQGVREAGGLPLEFPTISISEPFTRPTSLYLRNLMSMDVEEMISTSPIDGVVLLGGCDKTIPAQIMGAVSANKPAVLLASGPRPVSCHRLNRAFTVDDVWPLCDGRRSGGVDDTEWAELEANMNAGVGTCNVMGTASSMAAIAEVLGFGLPGSSFPDALSQSRRDIARNTGAEAVAAVHRNTKPRSLITESSLENAFRVITALGGSTNTLIHLEAIAGRAGIRIGMDRFDEWSQTTPYVTNVRPGGNHTLPALSAAGGVPRVMQEIRSLLNMQERTALDSTWDHAVMSFQATQDSTEQSSEPRDVVKPMSAQGSLRVLRGNLVPNGAIIKIAGTDNQHLLKHRGRVVIFDGIEDLNARIDDPDLEVEASSILILRGLGPIGAPGMPEVGHIPIPAKLHAAGVTDMVRISDARMSGTSTGLAVLHAAPEAATGGPLAYLQDGDEVELDVFNGTLNHRISPDELATRRPYITHEPPVRGYAKLHSEQVLQANEGCDFRFLLDPSTPQSRRPDESATLLNTSSAAPHHDRETLHG